MIRLSEQRYVTSQARKNNPEANSQNLNPVDYKIPDFNPEGIQPDDEYATVRALRAYSNANRNVVSYRVRMATGSPGDPVTATTLFLRPLRLDRPLQRLLTTVHQRWQVGSF